MRSRTRLWPVYTPYWTLRPVFGTPVESMYVCDLMPLAGSWGYSRHIVSLWHAFLTGHTFSSHKAALFRAETEILTRPPLKVWVFGSSAASNAQSALVFGFPQRVCLSTHSSRLCLANGRSSGEFWHDHAYHEGYPPPQSLQIKFLTHLRARFYFEPK